MNIFKKKLKDTEKAKIMEFIGFKLSSGVSLIQALEAYSAKESVSDIAIESIEDALDLLHNGETHAESLKTSGIVDDTGFMILSSNIAIQDALPLIQKTSVAKNEATRAVVSAMAQPLLMLAAMLVGMFFANDFIVEAYVMLDNVGRSANPSVAPMVLPSYLKYPWMSLGLLASLIGLGWGFVLTIKFAYLKRADLVYKVMPFRFYEDFQALLGVYLMLRKTGQSDMEISEHISNYAPNDFVSDLYSTAAINMRDAGSGLFDAFSEYESVIPSEFISFIEDADATGEKHHYMTAAMKLCEMRVISSRDMIKTTVGSLSTLAFALGIGLLLVQLMVDFTNMTLLPLIG